MFTTDAAVVAERDASFTIETVNLDRLQAHEVLVRIVASGVCHTDLSVRAGRTPLPLPAVLGHEGAGIVETVGGAVRTVKPGDKVILSFTSCGSCKACLGDHPAHCTDWASRNLLSGRRPDGSPTITLNGKPLSGSFFGQSSFARHAVVEERSLIKVDQNVQLRALAPLGCAIQTGVGTVVNVLKPEPQDSLVVFGAGAVGLAAVMGAAILGVKKIVVIDKIKSRLDIAVKCGATHAVEAGDTRALREAVGDTGFDFAIEATGNTKVLDQAIAGLASGGTCAVVGAPAAGSTISVDVKHLMRGRKIVGVTEGDSNPYEFIPWLIGRHLEGKLPIELLVTEYKFEDIEQAALDALSGAVIKPVIVY